jgi:hypothetical protein
LISYFIGGLRFDANVVVTVFTTVDHLALLPAAVAATIVGTVAQDAEGDKFTPARGTVFMIHERTP